MEAAAGHCGSLPVSSSSQPQRKEWRAVSENSFGANGNGEQDRNKLGQSDERTIYEVQEGTVPLEVDFCSITIDGGGLNDDILQQRLHHISGQREELQQIEIELRSQVIARSEIMAMQNNFDAQIKDHANAAAKLKEQLQEREQRIHELEMMMEEKERELRAVKIDNEAVWAKEDLLREQNKELATFRRERDNSEAERAQHLKQIHDLQEHIKDKDNHFLESEEQHRAAQETILYKDEQLREVQAWVTRAQEMESLQSTTIQSLQAELRERTERFNQYWIGLQRQCMDMERHHLQAIQQLQLELVEARERNGIHLDESQMAQANSKDSSSYGQNKVNQINADDSSTASSNPMRVANGDSGSSFHSAVGASTKAEHVPGLPVVPPSILGMGAFLPPGQMTAPHAFVMHPQGTPQSVTSTNSHIPQSQLGYFQPISTVPSHKHWQNQQALPEIHQMPNQNQYQPSQTEQNLLGADAHYSYELSADGQVVHSDYLEPLKSAGQESAPIISRSTGDVQLLESNGNRYLASQEPQETLKETSPFHTALGLELPQQNSEHKKHDEDATVVTNGQQEQVLTSEQPWSAANVTVPTVASLSVNSRNVSELNVSAIMPEISTPATRIPSVSPVKAPDPTLLDERSLLACIVRAIPAGSSSGIRISSTLPNRLGKMLAPLHWHDYKKQYGKLEDFVSHHPELFVIEEDFIHLREGAQEIISATTAVAKVAAAAAASAPYSSVLPSVAVTPVAQTHRLKKVPSADQKTVKTIPSTETSGQGNPGDLTDKSSQLSLHNQQPNGVSYNIVQGLSDLKILSKSKNPHESNGLSSEVRLGNSSVRIVVGNGSNLDRAALPSSQSRGASNGRHGFGGKHQGRATGAGLIARR